MEKIAGDNDDDRVNMKAETAIRCAKAAILLSSLRNSSSANEIEEEIEMEKLKLKLLMNKLVKQERELRRFIGVGMRMYFVGSTILVLLIAFNSL